MLVKYMYVGGTQIQQYYWAMGAKDKRVLPFVCDLRSRRGQLRYSSTRAQRQQDDRTTNRRSPSQA